LEQIGGDVISNKKTLLYLLALEKANPEQLEIFRQLENENDLELKVRNVRNLFDQLEIPKIAQSYMDNHFEKGISALYAISVAKERKKDLIDLSNYLMTREN
jgi:geranylgeranyl diphosphate synthase type II